MSGKYHDDLKHHRCVEEQSGDGVRTEKCLLRVPLLRVIPYVKYHRQYRQEHTEHDGAYEDRIYASDTRQRDHIVPRIQPQRLYDILKPENGTEHESEYCREHTGQGNNPPEIGLFEFVKKETADHQAESLSHITVHDSENEGVGHRDKDGRIHLTVIRQAVHLHVHLVRLEKSRIFEFCRRLCLNLRIVVLNHENNLLILRDIALQGCQVLLGHPAAQNIELLMGVLRDGCHLANVKIPCKRFQLRLRAEQSRCPLNQDFFHLPVDICDFPVDISLLLGKLSESFVRVAFVLIRDEKSLKVHGRIDCFDTVQLCMRSEIYAINVLIILPALLQDRVKVVVHVFLEPVQVHLRESSETEADELEPENIVDIIHNVDIGLNTAHLCINSGLFLFQIRLLLRKHGQILIQTSNQFDRLLERELVGGYRRDFVYHGTVGVGFGQQLPIRIFLYVRPQIMDLREFAHCIFQMNIISGQILVDHAVDVVPRTREGYEFHFYNHTYPPVLTSCKCFMRRSHMRPFSFNLYQGISIRDGHRRTARILSLNIRIRKVRSLNSPHHRRQILHRLIGRKPVPHALDRCSQRRVLYLLDIKITVHDRDGIRIFLRFHVKDVPPDILIQVTEILRTELRIAPAVEGLIKGCPEGFLRFGLHHFPDVLTIQLVKNRNRQSVCVGFGHVEILPCPMNVPDVQKVELGPKSAGDHFTALLREQLFPVVPHRPEVIHVESCLIVEQLGFRIFMHL